MRSILRRWVRGPLGVTPHRADQIQSMLKPGERLIFAFEAETKHSLPRLVLYVLSRGMADVLGRVHVVITDEAVLVIDREGEPFGEDRRLRSEMRLPPTLGPVKDGVWITLDGQQLFVDGGTRVVEQGEAALHQARSVSGSKAPHWGLKG